MNEPSEPQEHTTAPSDTTARRDAMLHQLVAAMHDLHQRRRRRKRVAATLTLMLLLGGVLLIALPRPVPQRGPQLAHEPQPQIQPSPEVLPATDPQPSRFEIVLVQTDPDIMQRYTVSDTPRLVQMIDDDELLATLAAIDRPTGIIRTRQAVWLTAAVTDEELSRNGEPTQPSRSIF